MVIGRQRAVWAPNVRLRLPARGQIEIRRMFPVPPGTIDNSPPCQRSDNGDNQDMPSTARDALVKTRDGQIRTLADWSDSVWRIDAVHPSTLRLVSAAVNNGRTRTAATDLRDRILVSTSRPTNLCATRTSPQKTIANTHSQMIDDIGRSKKRRLCMQGNRKPTTTDSHLSTRASYQKADIFLADDISEMQLEVRPSAFDRLQFHNHFGRDSEVTVTKPNMRVLFVRQSPFPIIGSSSVLDLLTPI